MFELPENGNSRDPRPANSEEDTPPEFGFAFRNHVTAAAVLYKIVNNKRARIFWGKEWVPGYGTLVPLEDRVQVWFEIPETKDVVDTQHWSVRHPVHFPGDIRVKKVHYDEKGLWNDVEDDKVNVGNPSVPDNTGNPPPTDNTGNPPPSHNTGNLPPPDNTGNPPPQDNTGNPPPSENHS